MLTSVVKVAVIGAGGTGSHVLTGLVDLHISLLALGHPGGLHVTCYDDDFVSEANVGRQKFVPSDVGSPKAVVLINRANMLFDTDWKAVVSRINDRSSVGGNYDLVIGCVDNRKARADIIKRFTNCYYLDFGNRKDDGQVILGELTYGKKTQDNLPHIGELFPDSINPDLEDPDDGPSCSLAEALEKQSLFINKSVADYGLNILSMLFRHGEIDYHGGFINLKSGRATPLGINSDVWQRFGYKLRKKPGPKPK